MSNDITTEDQLLSFIERTERVKAEIESLQNDVRDVYAEARSNGFDVKAIKEIIKLRAKSKEEIVAFDAMVDLYTTAIERAVARRNTKVAA